MKNCLTRKLYGFKGGSVMLCAAFILERNDRKISPLGLRPMWLDTFSNFLEFNILPIHDEKKNVWSN